MKTLVWDVDDVLCPLMARWHASWRAGHPDAPPYDQLTANPPHALLGLTKAAYHDDLDAFRLAHYAALPPDPDALAFLRTRGHRYRHVALTSQPRHTAHLVAGWVVQHLGHWFRTFAFVPTPRPGDDGVPRYERSKGEWLATLRSADLFLDDRPDNVASARAAGIEAWVVKQPWNDGAPLAELLSRL